MNATQEERQVKAWEKIADALERIAKAQTGREYIEQARLEIEKKLKS
jgi:hypothetical protein